MNLPFRISRRIRLAALAAVLVVSPFVVPTGSQAVINSDFDTQDGNLVADSDVDWASVTETRRNDLASGANDNSFGTGTKEDTRVPSVVSGSIPNNKSDLKTFGVYFEDTGSARYLHLFWSRVQEPSGTTNMDFEFNQSSTISANGVTPVRTAGDLLIQYDLASGGTSPELFVSQWVTTGDASQCEAANKVPCWGDRIDLGANAVGSVNTTAISPGSSDGLGALDPFTFGEATIDFDAVVPGASDCEAFAFAYLKSRSSDSFTAALKDFIAPLNPGINSCGAIKITKTRKHAAAGGTGPHAGVPFKVKLDGVVVAQGSTNSQGTVCFDGLAFDDYVVREVPQTGYAVNPNQNVTVDNAAACDDDPYVGESVSFVNTPLTNITVTVNSQVDGGTASTIDCHPAPGVDQTIPATAPDNGDGSYSMNNLEPGTYNCEIYVDP
jgi:hypothetical protein